MINKDNALEKWAKENRYPIKEFAGMIGISPQALRQLRISRSPLTTVRTCLIIEQITGLKPWDYIDGLEAFKNISNKK